MVFKEPIILKGGDSNITIKFGDDGSLYLNLYILTFEKITKSRKPQWLVDTTALRTTIMLTFDPLLIQIDGVIAAVEEIIADGISVPNEYPSRIVHLPVFYNDPLTRECAKCFNMPPNLEVMAKENNTSVDEIIRRHEAPEYFVSYTSFMFGSVGAFPIGKYKNIKNSKYKTPRTWTPPGTVGIGGSTTAIYSMKSPGGVMMLGNIPIKTYDIDAKNKHFENGNLLVHPGDRIKFHCIDANQYERLKNQRDSYAYEIESSHIEWKSYGNM
ncbi:MAG: carboxyltransferase domain-containing protein [Desulfobacterales bacterium]|nr:MAG: carboxyltransferase domain-containing protein [Desulfobacterales bacterium]